MEMIKRSLGSEDFQTREDSEKNELIIEGYFSVFDSPYEIGRDAYETVSRNAFSDTLGGDIRALINHDTSLVLGRTTVGTLELATDEHGLFGRIKINPNDSDAMNIYERVKRGDVNQCSFGFEILDESTEILEDKRVHFSINKVRLHEVSVCTFPAYEETAVSARSAEAGEYLKKREIDAWRVRMMEKLTGGAE